MVWRVRKLIAYNSLSLLVPAIIGVVLSILFFYRYYSPEVFRDFGYLSSAYSLEDSLSTCIVHRAGLGVYSGYTTSFRFSSLVESTLSSVDRVSECFKFYMATYSLDFSLQFFPFTVVASTITLYLFLRRLSHLSYLQVLVARGYRYYLRVLLAAVLLVVVVYFPSSIYFAYTLSRAAVGFERVVLTGLFFFFSLLLSALWSLVAYLVARDMAAVLVFGFTQFFWMLIDPSSYSATLNPGLRLALEAIVGKVDSLLVVHYVVVFIVASAPLLLLSKRIVEVY